MIAQTLQTHSPGAAHVDRVALHKEGAALVYRCAKQHSEPGSDKRGAKVDELHLTPLDLIDRIAAPVPAQQATAQPAQTGVGVGVTGVAPDGNAAPTQPEPVPPKRSPAQYLWAALIARFLSPCGTDRSYAQRTSSVLN